jgi:ABC-2 type transport system ATP-binding protein
MDDLRVEAHNLQKTFGPVRAVNDVSLCVRSGEAYGLVGPDGAGKTTTMRLLVGALTSEGGSVHIGPHRLDEHPEQARANIGYLAQRFSLYEDLTVAENLRFFGEVRGLSGSTLEERAAELFGFVGLSGFERRLAGRLSGGMKQKLGLACALVHRPAVLLLDEPSGGVDPVTRQDFWRLIIRLLAETGLAVVVSTPYMDEATRCTRVGFMSQGRMLAEGTPRQLTATLNGRILEIAAKPANRARQVCEQDHDIEDVATFGDRLHLRLRAGCGPVEQVQERLSNALAADDVQVTFLRPVKPGLEDVFISLLTGTG